MASLRQDGSSRRTAANTPGSGFLATTATRPMAVSTAAKTVPVAGPGPSRPGKVGSWLVAYSLAPRCTALVAAASCG